MHESPSQNKIDAKKLIGCDSLSEITKYFVNMGELHTDPVDTLKILKQEVNFRQ